MYGISIFSNSFPEYHLVLNSLDNVRVFPQSSYPPVPPTLHTQNHYSPQLTYVVCTQLTPKCLKKDTHYVLQLHLFNLLKMEHFHKGMIPRLADKPLVIINLSARSNESNSDGKFFSRQSKQHNMVLRIYHIYYDMTILIHNILWSFFFSFFFATKWVTTTYLKFTEI